MGFWSSLIHTAVQVSHWVANNSGSIASAAGTIAKVAGALALTADEIEAEGDNILPILHNHVSKAEEALLLTATTQFPQPIIPSGSSLKVVDMPALWPSPGTSKGDDKVPPELGMDINRLLALQKIPHVFGKKGTDPQIDVGDKIATQLFVPADDKRKIGDMIYYNAVSVTPNNRQTPSITGGMVFYPIPLGNPGTHAAWHSHIRLYYLSSSADEKVFQDELRALAMKQGPSKVSQEQPYSAATLSVQWTGARGVSELMTKAVNHMQDHSNGGISILKPAFIDGTRFKYQFKVPTSMGPAEVAGALSAALGKVLPPPSEEHPLPRMPTVKVANLQTYVPDLPDFPTSV